MQTIIDSKQKNMFNVIYKVTLYQTDKEPMYYIGKTARELKSRLYEHTHNVKSAVYQYVKRHNIGVIKIEVIDTCKYIQQLDTKETLAIAKHIIKYGKKKHRLVNKDFKGLDKLTMRELKELSSLL